MKKWVLFSGIVIIVVTVIVSVSMYIFSNEEYIIVDIEDANDRTHIMDINEVLKDDNEIERIVLDNHSIWLPDGETRFENPVEFLLGSDNYLYVIENDLDLDKVRIPGTDLKGYKTKINNLVDLFYCSGVAQSDEVTIYALDKEGNLYFITSIFALDIEALEATQLKYKNIIDVYSKQEVSYDEAGDELYSIDNYARDIEGNIYSLTKDYSGLYYGI